MKKAKGSITIFATLSFLIIVSVLFTFLESARVWQVHRITEWNAEAAIESVFSQYDLELWNQYHLLALKGKCDGEAVDVSNYWDYIWKSETDKSNTKGYLLAVNPTQINNPGYTLLTDQNGEIYEALAASYMKEKGLFGIGKTIFNDFLAVQEVEKSYGKSKEWISQARETVEELSWEDGPIEVVDGIEKQGILSLVLADDATISTGRIALQESLQKRTRLEGVNSIQVNNAWYDDILFQEYLGSCFGNYLDTAEASMKANANEDRNNGKLQYQMEYILAGKGSDVENLKSVVRQILLVREAVNMMFLCTDSVKNNEALAMATLIAGASANPLIVEAVKYGILASWAYVESILDLRTLLNGDKIALLKTPATWTSELKNLTTILKQKSQAIPSKTGLSYSEYLFLLLLKERTSEKAYRAMDVQEQTLSAQNPEGAVRMDQMVVGLDSQITYEWNTVFLSFVSIGRVQNKRFMQEKNVSFTFLTAGV